MRITRPMLTRSFLGTLERGNARLARLQEEVATGKKLIRPSDDPSGAARALDREGRLTRIDTLLRNVNRGLSTLGMTDAALGEAGDLIGRAREIAIQSANPAITAEDRKEASIEVESLLTRLLQVANTREDERYIFGGQRTLEAPFAGGDEGIVYRGDEGMTLGRIHLDEEVSLLIPGRSAFGATAARLGGAEDLDPDLWELTRLDDLHGGAGVALSALRITDGASATATVSLAGTSTVADVIERINGAGLAVTAELNAEGNGIALVSSGSGTVTVAEEGDGIAASELGILGSFTGRLDGTDLDPALSETTPLHLLRSGGGLSAGALLVETTSDGVSRSGRIDLTDARSVGDVLILIARGETATGEDLGIRAEIDPSGSSLAVRAAFPNGRIAVRSETAATVAEELGLSGGAGPRSLFTVLESLRDDLANDDTSGIDDVLRSLDGALSGNLIARVEVGSRVDRMESVRESLTARRVGEETAIAELTDADLTEVLVKSNQEQIAYQAALSATSRAISTSLMDFLR